MFYNHELLKRSGRFGVLWLAATKPKLLTESEYRQCDLKALCEEIREFIQYRARREQGKPLFRSVNLTQSSAYSKFEVLSLILSRLFVHDGIYNSVADYNSSRVGVGGPSVLPLLLSVTI